MAIEPQDNMPLDETISTEIYNAFVAGKVITKMTYNNRQHELTPNPLYSYLFTQQPKFNELYRLIGKELKHQVDGDFFYIASVTDGESDEADKHALQTQTLILIIARYFEATGRNSLLLGEPHLGFTDEDIKTIEKNAEYNALLTAISMKSWHSALVHIPVMGISHSGFIRITNL